MTGSDDYEVGYGRPPKKSQFQPGRSGNVHGRRKKAKDNQVDPAMVLDQPVVVREAGRRRTMQPKEVTLRKLVKRALGGERKAIQRLLDQMAQYGVLASAPQRASVGGVLTLSTRRMPFAMAEIMARRFGARKRYTKAQLKVGRDKYVAGRTEQQAMIDAAIGYPDLAEDEQ